jgi:hypothetical protein
MRRTRLDDARTKTKRPKARKRSPIRASVARLFEGDALVRAGALVSLLVVMKGLAPPSQ